LCVGAVFVAKHVARCSIYLYVCLCVYESVCACDEHYGVLCKNGGTNPCMPRWATY